MDILDIDEMLKDDSFHFLEEKNPDDVSNIIQQWKNQNSTQQQQQQQHCNTDVQQQNETYKIDSKTFTRPRRSAAQKLEKQFSNMGNGPESQLSQQQQQQNQQHEFQVPEYTQRQSKTPVLNVQIGGKVRTPLSARSMLQDTSPPSSICSMDASQESFNMDNSLITSADFTHLNFLLSTPTLERSFNFNEPNCAGYTLGDMIRDRKALESLTLSADDGALIKDSQISQIDDISLSMLKSSSGCNSMVNSVESVECNFNDRTMQLSTNSTTGNSYQNQTLTKLNVSDNVSSAGDAMQCTTVIKNSDLVGDSTFTMLENGKSFIISRRQMEKETEKPTKVENQRDELAESLAELKVMRMNETVCLRKADDESEPAMAGNETFDCQEPKDDLHPNDHTPETSMKMYESTPHATTRMRYGVNKNSYTPAIRKIVEDPNISPIVGMDSNQQMSLDSPKTTKASATYCQSPLSRYKDIEFLENMENPNQTFNCRSRQRQKQLQEEERDREQRHQNEIELQDIMDLAQAEAEMLNTANGDDDEEQFEHMLDEFSRIKINAEQLKMQKSLDKIKKRFNCTLSQAESDTHHTTTTTSSNEYGSGLSNTFTSETKQETLRKLRDTFRNDTTTEMSGTRSNSSDMMGSGSGSGSSFIVPSMAASGSSSGERLLSRRSRLNDDLSFSSIKPTSQLSSEINTSAKAASYHSSDKENSPENKAEKQKEVNDEQTPRNSTETSETAKYKLLEQRERDRDRFKTIKIIRNRNEEIESATQTVLNVPCIDDDDNYYHDDDDAVNKKVESEGKHESSLRNENESRESETQTKASVVSSKRVSRSDLDNLEKRTNLNTTTTTSRPSAFIKPPEARSLSRPRYISGLQKFSAVSKAVSAGDLEENVNNALPNETKTSQLSKIFDARRTQASAGNAGFSKPASNLKSPMGIKAKSLHNLAYSNQGPSSSSSAAANSQSRIGTFGLRKINSGGFGLEQQQQRMQKQPHQQATQMKQKPCDNFKKPHPPPPAGLQSSTTRPNRQTAAGIARPSSGYYSLNVGSKVESSQVATHQGITDSSIQMPSTVGATRNIAATTAEEPKVPKATTSNTGIPKPSGLRPPHKRSGLPRPSSMVRR